MTTVPPSDPSVGPAVRELMLKDPTLTVADAQLRIACRRLPMLLWYAAFVVGIVFALKNDLGGRTSTTESMSWIGEWVVAGESCNGHRYRIRSSTYAEPKMSSRKAIFERRPTKDDARFSLKDGTRIELHSIDWMTLRWRSSAVPSERILTRCLNPFMFGKH